MTKIPHLSLCSSLLYLRAPQRLVLAGRKLGRLWSFHHPVHGRIPVVSGFDLAEEVFAENLRFAGEARLQDWLGVTNPFGHIPIDSRRVLLQYVERAIEGADPRYHLDVALRSAAQSSVDVGPALRAATLRWLVDAFCQSNQLHAQPALAAALCWQRSASTVPLLAPRLRRWSSIFQEVAPAKLRLLDALSACASNKAIGGRYGSYIAGGILTMFGPIADALPMLAMAALAHRSPYNDIRISHALSTAHPMPLLVLEARRYVELQKCGLMLDPENLLGCTNGTQVAIDLPGSCLPFGVGALAGTLRAVVTRFLTAALGVASKLDITAVEQPRTGRVRLCVGPTGLRMAKWPG